jgi:hypothetical protein
LYDDSRVQLHLASGVLHLRYMDSITLKLAVLKIVCGLDIFIFADIFSCTIERKRALDSVLLFVGVTQDRNQFRELKARLCF